MSIPLISRCLFFLVLTVVTYLALAPQDEVVISTGWDKLNHVLAFLVLLGLLDYGYPEQDLWPRKCAVLLAYGLLIESIQYYLPSRSFSLLDLVSDSIGLLAFIALKRFIEPVIPFGKH